MYNLSDFQKSNLKKLADYLIKLPEDYEHFDMSIFYHTTNDDTMAYEYMVPSILNLNRCGTVACALGHGPAAGIIPDDLGISWEEYSSYFINEDFEDGLWPFLFSDDWTGIDNTPQGAAKRIYWILDGNEVFEIGIEGQDRVNETFITR